MEWITESCSPQNPISLYEIHGTQDNVTWWDGDLDNIGGWGAYLGTLQGIEFWSEMNNCTELNLKNKNEQIILSGWINKKRDHGNLLFIDLRDNFGLTQCVIDKSNKFFKELEKTQLESVIKVQGTVVERTRETINPELKTGEIEVKIISFEILGHCKELPMPVFTNQEYAEDIRLKYRFLDLRRKKIHENIILGGDFNIIPSPEDVYNVKSFEDDALYRLEIRKKLREMINLGFHDGFRHINSDKEGYTFWDYMRGAWQKNNGMRIDHFLVSNSLLSNVKNVKINKDPRGKEKPSDHTPIEIELT